MRITKKEKALLYFHGYQYDVVVRHYITISYNDTENILKVHDKMLDHCTFVLKRVTRRIKLFNRYIYFNTVYGG